MSGVLRLDHGSGLGYTGWSSGIWSLPEEAWKKYIFIHQDIDAMSGQLAECMAEGTKSHPDMVEHSYCLYDSRLRIDYSTIVCSTAYMFVPPFPFPLWGMGMALPCLGGTWLDEIRCLG